jgi:hypothetical protein
MDPSACCCPCRADFVSLGTELEHAHRELEHAHRMEGRGGTQSDQQRFTLDFFLQSGGGAKIGQQ